MSAALKARIGELYSSAVGFTELALEVYELQVRSNPTYRRFIELLGRLGKPPEDLHEIPLIPVSLFKDHDIRTDTWESEKVFRSSGTTGQKPSVHYIRELAWYHNMCVKGFSNAFGPPEDYCHLALLPSYLERNDSSLVEMVDHFIGLSPFKDSGFFLNEHGQLLERLRINMHEGHKTILWGVAFGLLDFLDSVDRKLNFSDLIVIETGGMKGRRKEIIRSELHSILQRGFGVDQIYSEYGMTELQSQAYTNGSEWFAPSPGIRFVLKDINDPLESPPEKGSGRIGCIDLGNIDTCSFLLTDDIGKMKGDQLNVLGRRDASEIRGCNLMIESMA